MSSMRPRSDDQQPSLLDRFLDAVEETTGKWVRRSDRDEVSVCCPGHDDQSPSLSVRYDEEGDLLLLCCHTICTNEEVVAAIGWEMRDLYGSHAAPAAPRKPAAPSRADMVRARFFANMERQIALEATPAYWLRRAEQFGAVANERCDQIAEACRHRAEVASW